MEIKLEFTVNARDIFRVLLELSKVRIFLGLAFSLFLITGLVVFFFIIDEKRILIETSPLFVAVPLLAVGGQILRLHATCRKYVLSLSPSQRLMQYVFSDEADGFEVHSGDSFGRIGWADVSKIVEQTKHFLIFLNKYDVRVIPKEALASPKELNLFRSILMAKLGSRTQLLPQAED
jgi:hypothetical protein